MNLEHLNQRPTEATAAQTAHSSLAREAFGKGVGQTLEAELTTPVTKRQFDFNGGYKETVALNAKTGLPETIVFSQIGHSAELTNRYDKNLHLTQQTLKSDFHNGKRDVTTTDFDAQGKATAVTRASLDHNQLKSTDRTDIARGVTVHDDFKTGALFDGCAPSHPRETISHGKGIESPSVGKDGKKLPDTYDALVATLQKGIAGR